MRVLSAAATAAVVLVAVVGTLVAAHSAAEPTMFQNPVIAKQRPDPGVLKLANGTYVAATTSFMENMAFPLQTSTDLANWTAAGFLFPDPQSLPVWAATTNATDMEFWAPEIHQLGADYFVAYYVCRDRSGVLCIGAAIAQTPLGPFKDLGVPLLRNATMGQIDPTLYLDGEQPYLLWKWDGNAVGEPTPLWIAPLASDGLALTGAPVRLIDNSLPWEGPVVEAPWLITVNGSYYLFYSANVFNTAAYCIGVARASALLGPYEKLSAGPIVASNAAWSGPGHCSVVPGIRGDGDWAIIYHAWQGQNIGGQFDRMMLLDGLEWSADGWPQLPTASPSIHPTPIP